MELIAPEFNELPGDFGSSQLRTYCEASDLSSRTALSSPSALAWLTGESATPCIANNQHLDCTHPSSHLYQPLKFSFALPCCGILRSQMMRANLLHHFSVRNRQQKPIRTRSQYPLRSLSGTGCSCTTIAS